LSQRDEAMQLVRDAVMAGILGDLGTGSSIDICVITKHNAELIRPYDSTVVDECATQHARSHSLALSITTC